MRQQKAFNLRAAKPVLLMPMFINTVFITRGNWKYTLLFKWAGAKMQQNANEQATLCCVKWPPNVTGSVTPQCPSPGRHCQNSVHSLEGEKHTHCHKTCGAEH